MRGLPYSLQWHAIEIDTPRDVATGVALHMQGHVVYLFQLHVTILREGWLPLGAGLPREAGLASPS